MEATQRRHVGTTRTSDGAQTRSAAPNAGAATGLRKPRHAGLFEAIHRLDTGLDPVARDELARWIRDQYTAEYGDVPLGFVSTCHLGPPYVEHRLSLTHDIVEHFSPGQAMPEPFEGARMLTRSGSYAYIEIYGSGLMVPVMTDGTPVVPGTRS
jgi:hypothetical protein